MRLTAIKKRCVEIADERTRLDTELLALQVACCHPVAHVTQKNGANTGNYDGPRFDLYWIDHSCQICGKWWREDTSPHR